MDQAVGSSGHTWFMGMTGLLHGILNFLISFFTALTKIYLFSNCTSSLPHAIIVACKVLDRMLQW